MIVTKVTRILVYLVGYDVNIWLKLRIDRLKPLTGLIRCRSKTAWEKNSA